jgi:hypothetical protein
VIDGLMHPELIKILAVVAGLVVYYLVFRYVSRGKKPARPARTLAPPLVEAPNQPAPKRKKTFGELLAEFDQMVETNLPKPAPEDTRRLREQRTPLTDTPQLPEVLKAVELSAPDLLPRTLEQPVPEARSLEAPPIQGSFASSRIVPPARRFAKYDLAQSSPSPIALLVQDPEQLRNAFVLSEILKRKWL